MKARFLKPARDELRAAIRYYEDRRPGLGVAFRKEVAATIERIKGMPEAWQQLGPNTRRCRTHKFPYGVIDQPRRDEVLIVAVAHLHREPGHWEDRL